MLVGVVFIGVIMIIYYPVVDDRRDLSLVGVDLLGAILIMEHRRHPDDCQSRRHPANCQYTVPNGAYYE